MCGWRQLAADRLATCPAGTTQLAAETLEPRRALARTGRRMAGDDAAFVREGSRGVIGG